MIRITDQYFWNFIFLLFFVALEVMAIIILSTEAHLSYAELTFFDISIITFASFRLIRLFVHDTIMKFFREQFYDAKVSRGKVTLHKPASGPRRTIADLLSCPWCFGTWATAMVVFFYMLTPLAHIPILILAIAAVATVFQNISCVIANRI